MQNYQQIKWSRSYGGAKHVFTGTETGVSCGLYEVDYNTVPNYLYGMVPAGTPVYADDAKKKIAFHFAFETYAITAYSNGNESFDVKLKKGSEGSRCVAGMKLGVMPSTDANLLLEVTDVFTVTNVDRTSTLYDVVTVSCTARTVSTSADQIAAGTVLVELAEQVDDSGKYFVKVLPNGITFYDVAKDPNVVLMGIDYMFCQPDGVVLTNRIPPIADVVRNYMRSKDVYLRYSTAKE